jgi:hypothetical protein
MMRINELVREIRASAKFLDSLCLGVTSLNDTARDLDPELLCVASDRFNSEIVAEAITLSELLGEAEGLGLLGMLAEVARGIAVEVA